MQLIQTNFVLLDFSSPLLQLLASNYFTETNDWRNAMIWEQYYYNQPIAQTW